MAVFAGSLVLLVGVLAVRLSVGAGLPSLLLYLAIGLALGESGLGLPFEDAALTTVLGTLALAVIIGEGGLSTRWSVMRPVLGLAGLLATVGVAVSVAVTAVLSHALLDVDWRTALLLGAVVGSTDAAATFSVLRRLPVRPRLRATLEAESGLNDPPVIILVTLVASDAWETASGWAIAGQLVLQVVLGVGVGLAAGAVGATALRRGALPSSGLYPLATFTWLLLAFSGAALLGGSGLMAVYVAGLWLGNSRLPHHQASLGFAEGLAWLAQIALFVLLGLLASPARLLDALLPAAAVGLALTVVARPLAVAVCSVWARLPWREQVFLSWAGLRGAVPIVLATIPVAQGLPSATRIFDVVFVLVVVFTLLQAPTLPWLARRTGVAVATSPLDLAVESAPLEGMSAALLQLEVPQGSQMAGLYVTDLRLPPEAALALVHREGRVLVPDAHTTLRSGDTLLLAVPDPVRRETERRLRAVARRGRLAYWHGERREPSPRR
nr:potassium/proton antiporter [Nocardioides perillae]